MRDSYEIHSVLEVHKVFAEQCVHMFTHACGALNLQVSKMSVAWLTKSQTLRSLNDHSLQSQGAHQVLSRSICFCCMLLFFSRGNRNHVWFQHYTDSSPRKKLRGGRLESSMLQGEHWWYHCHLPEKQDRQQGNPQVLFQGTHLFLGCSIMMLDCWRVVTKAEKSVENVKVESSRGQFARWSGETVKHHGIWSSDWMKDTHHISRFATHKQGPKVCFSEASFQWLGFGKGENTVWSWRIWWILRRWAPFQLGALIITLSME